jgi:hypothetical protein
MSRCIVHFGDDVIVGFESWPELRDWLEHADVETGVPDPMLDLLHETGTVLTIALGGLFGALDYTSGSHVEPYYAAVGDSGLPRAGETRRFSLSDGGAADVALRYCLPRDVLLRVIEVFFAGGGRSDAVEWDTAEPYDDA